MKNIYLPFFRAGLVAAAIIPAHAIEAPADDAPPPPAADQPVGEANAAPAPQLNAEVAPEAPAAPAEAKDPVAYLGVVSSEVPDMLSEHLQLKPGEGIIIRSTLPDGPAAKAGLVENDIITRIGGEAVGNSMDLTREVTSHKPGDVLKLDVIQKGKPGQIEVTLGTRPDQIADLNLQPLDNLNLDGIPRELADRVRGAIEGNLGGFDLGGGDPGAQGAPQMEQAMKEMRLRIEKAMKGLEEAPGLDVQGIPGVPNINVQQGATIRMMDEKGSIELKSNDGGKEVTLRDKENNITWSGPWDTDQDKAAAPDDVRQRVERLNIDTNFNGKGLRLQMNGGRLNLNPE